MEKKEIILSEASRDYLPKTLSANDYYAVNDQFVQDEYRLKQEISDYCKELELEPWAVELARLYSQGLSLDRIAKDTGKKRQTLEKLVKTGNIQKLIHFFIHLKIFQDGPNELLRKNMLWRIAVDNESDDPKESIKALAELNRMSQNKRGGGGFNIVINGVVAGKGALDA